MKIKYTRNHGFITRYLKHKIVGNAQINNIAKILLRDLIPRKTECPNGKKNKLTRNHGFLTRYLKHKNTGR